MRPLNIVAILFLSLATFDPATGEDLVDFNRDVRPILSDRCFICHGPDMAANESGLRLDIGEEALDWEAFIPGEPDESSGIERMMTDDPDLVMPPPGSHLTLTDDEISLLRKWVQQGARYDQHWSFKPLPPVVAVPDSASDPWSRNEIDAFVLQKLTANNLRPSPESEKWRWLRRVTFDLTGLPPTPEQIRNFEKDSSPDAFERVVDRLLDSKDYGKHMSVAWLDAARYADSYGYQADLLSPTWHWRDWVVRSLNANLPYDQFLAWQIAGDLQPAPTTDSVLATGFNRLHRQTNEGGSVALEWQTEYVADRVNTFGTAMLGMTIECARCHDHKYDPVSHQDYYNLFAFFNNIDEWGMYHDSARVPTPTLLLPNDDQKSVIAELENSARVHFDLELKFRVEAGKQFDKWLEKNELLTVESKPVAHWSLDERNSDQQFSNTAEAGKAATTSAANTLVEGFPGQALKLTGDDGVEFPIEGNWLEAWQPWSISLWLHIPEGLNESTILHRQGGTDVGNFGTKVSLIDGRVRFEITRFWPGNALAVETLAKFPANSWHQLVVTNDGSGTAEGMKVYVDGTAETRIHRNQLTKDPQHRPANNTGFVVGEQFRRFGLKNGRIDEVSVFDMALTRIEIVALLEAAKHEQEASSGNQASTNSEAEPKKALTVRADRFEVPELKAFHVASLLSHDLRAEPVLQVQKLLQARVAIQETMVMRELPSVRPAHVLHRGDYDSPRSADNLATRATPVALPPLDDAAPRNRLGLAKWLVASDHPLTARVAANRFWQGFFGEGLVTTSNDFGLQGSIPTHTELLDWLARDFVDNGWDTKRLCKQIVLSATYRQNSRCDSTLRDLDPKNALLARGPSRRLTAEMIRDMALFVGGLLNNKTGGAPVSPYQPQNLWRENNTMTPGYNQSVGKDLYRRSLYTVWKRTTPLPNMMTFDATSRDVCTVKRSDTNTPLQAMVLLNDVQFVEAARVLAEKTILDHSDKDDDGNRKTSLVSTMFVRLCGRHADGNETVVLKSILENQLAEFGKDIEAAKQLVSVGEHPVNEEVDPVELAAVTVVAQAILNSDAAIWRR